MHSISFYAQEFFACTILCTPVVAANCLGIASGALIGSACKKKVTAFLENKTSEQTNAFVKKIFAVLSTGTIGLTSYYFLDALNRDFHTRPGMGGYLFLTLLASTTLSTFGVAWPSAKI